LWPDLQCPWLVCWCPQWQGRSSLANYCTRQGVL